MKFLKNKISKGVWEEMQAGRETSKNHQRIPKGDLTIPEHPFEKKREIYIYVADKNLSAENLESFRESFENFQNAKEMHS